MWKLIFKETKQISLRAAVRDKYAPFFVSFVQNKREKKTPLDMRILMHGAVCVFVSTALMIGNDCSAMWCVSSFFVPFSWTFF